MELSQNKRIVQRLKGLEASRYMLSKELEIPIQSVCRRVDFLIRQGRVKVLRIDKCKVSGRQVEFISSNPNKFKNPSQLSLWQN